MTIPADEGTALGRTTAAAATTSSFVGAIVTTRSRMRMAESAIVRRGAPAPW